MSFKSVLANFFRKIFTGLFNRHSKSLVDFALGQAVGFAAILVSQDIPGKEKAKIVKEQLKQSLILKGTELAEHELNLLVEMAVSHLKSLDKPADNKGA